jgi:hypothetical protein
MPCEQQPLAQDAAVHWQVAGCPPVPGTQTWPVAHAGPLPQVHTPLLLQVLAFVVSHCVQEPEGTPQLVREMVSHVFPLQQPLVHVWVQPRHVLFTQLVPPAVHDVHEWPLTPQTPSWLPGWQTPLASQQPPGQLEALHAHTPPTQARPAPQAAPVPHLQTPLVHVSLLFGSHTLHAAPPVPHVARDVVELHVVPEQHPPAQELASQMHVPFEHR